MERKGCGCQRQTPKKRFFLYLFGQKHHTEGGRSLGLDVPPKTVIGKNKFQVAQKNYKDKNKESIQ
jgi:hypothetical protein